MRHAARRLAGLFSFVVFVAAMGQAPDAQARSRYARFLCGAFARASARRFDPSVSSAALAALAAAASGRCRAATSGSATPVRIAGSGGAMRQRPGFRGSRWRAAPRLRRFSGLRHRYAGPTGCGQSERRPPGGAGASRAFELRHGWRAGRLAARGGRRISGRAWRRDKAPDRGRRLSMPSSQWKRYRKNLGTCARQRTRSCRCAMDPWRRNGFHRSGDGSGACHEFEGKPLRPFCHGPWPRR